MKKTFLLKLLVLVFVLGLFYSFSRAQEKTVSEPESTVYPEHLSGFYIGLRGGYLFKNDDLSRNPAMYLNSGYFGELNAGWRAKNSWFGWNLSLGRLNIKREIHAPEKNAFELNGYDVMKSTNPNWMWDSITQDGRTFNFDTSSVKSQGKKDLESWYAMTGPEFWYDRGRLQGFLSLNAGVGMTKFGYYYIQGGGSSSNALTYDYYSKDNDEIAGQVDVNIFGNYEQYGMSQEAFGSYPPSPDIEDKSVIHFMARGTLGLEYFVTPKFSINANAAYWYIMTPSWESHLNSRGELTYKGEWVSPNKPGADDMVDPTGGAISGATGYNIAEDFSKKNIGMLSGNLGIRYWMGKKSTPQPQPAPDPVVETPLQEAPVLHKKSLLVTAKDKPTGFALSGVKVSVTKNGQSFSTGFTDVNGSLKEIGGLEAGNYEIRGILNGIETTVAHLDSSDFTGENRVLSRELLHNDLRFTLVGHTLNAETEGNLPHVRTTLTQMDNGTNSSQTSNKEGEFRFQLKPDADFEVVADQKGYFSNKEQVTTKGLDRSKTLYVDLRLAVNELKKGAQFELKDIYYDFDESNIRSDAAIILDNVYKMMEDNPTLVIELSSHTDSRGSDSYNLKLSQERANSAVEYLNNKGVSTSRLIAKGYGETQLVNGCSNGVSCSDEQHQANRRTEIKIIKE